MMLTLVAVLASGTPNLEVVDVSSYRDNLRVYSDGHKHDIALWAGGSDTVIFYGDGTTFYQLGIFSSSRSGDAFDVMFSDPRYRGAAVEAGIVTKDGSSLDVYCGTRHTAMPKLEKTTYKTMIAKAEFKRSPWAWQSYALSRDDKGTYYYVDRGRYDDNNMVFHVYIGPRGNLKEQKLKNIVHDSAGDIFATGDGDLRLIVGDKPETEWINKDQHTKLTVLSTQENRHMVWNDLGVYNNVRYGTPCDDL